MNSPYSAFILALLTNQYLLNFTLIRNPGEFSSIIRTKSSAFNLSVLECHLFLSCCSWRYSFSHFIQNWEAICFTKCHPRLTQLWFSSITPHGQAELPFNITRWLGMLSSISWLHLVMGLLFTIFSTSHSADINTESVKLSLKLITLTIVGSICRVEVCTFDYYHDNLHTYGFGPAEFK